MPGRLEHLLRRIRDGLAEPGELAEARALARSDARIPEELRQLALADEDDLAGDAAGLLAVLGADDLLGDALFEAIFAEAGPMGGPADDAPEEPLTALVGAWPELDAFGGSPLDEPSGDDPEWAPLGEALREGLRAASADVDLADAVGRALGLAHVEVAAAVRAEAGAVELTRGVEAALGFALPDVAAALRAEMGAPPELAGDVLAALGAPVLPVAEAVIAEAGAAEVGACELAAPVLTALGEAPAPVAEALRAEAGRVELAGSVLASLGRSVLPVAEAVRAEAGPVDLADAVDLSLSPEALAGVLDHQLDDVTHRLVAAAIHEDQRGDELTAMADLGSELRSALRAEAGPVELWAAVAGDIGIADPEHVEGWDARLLGEALRAEAGSVDLADAVLREVRRTRPVQMPLAEVPLESLPPRANRSTWALGGLLAVAVALFAVQLQGVLAPLFQVGAPGIEAVPELTFASADELVVEDLQYGEDVTVFQTEGDDGAVIIWVDEEAVL